LRRLRTLEEENSKLKQLVGDWSLEKKMLQDVLSKNFEARRQAHSGTGGAKGMGIRRRKRSRRKSVQVRETRSMPQRANHSWSMDFLSDQRVGGQRFRLLTIVDDHCRESVAIEVGQRLTRDDVVRVLDGVASQRGKPQTIRLDNAPEFISKSLNLWAYFNGVTLGFAMSA
jgi:transposase InsO family protein